MPHEISQWDIQEHLQTRVEQDAYLEAAFDDGDALVIIGAIGDVIRARGPEGIAAQVGIEHTALLEAFRDGNDPPFSLVLAAVRALGFKLGVCRTSKF
ncbi:MULTISPECIES: addiction module antidote protein [unclassified Aliiroseovarius]|jgi:probable addiction module antidote protein|uniref:addiction module antidote protein n=1 Tax=unclassified Aliiroseovarius TaxID=2623558 RepID=UPI001568A259|nr:MULTISPECIES: addiction module antidote protein [unclassified Aliiroseovarius]MDP7150235.1 putative addiction module antidote protein [Paracoccaceae bacterium]MDP7184891.1 putative addiction module antidote protein [Paracoccaceae bacterium]